MTQATVAIKVIKKMKGSGYKKGLDMTALREIKYLREMASIQHPNIVKVGSTLVGDCDAEISSS